MSNNLYQLIDTCRFCLCEAVDSLISIPAIIDETLTEKDIERFTGIQLRDDDIISHSVCEDCYNKLRSFSAYRLLCLSNDARFKELLATFLKSAKNHTAGIEPCEEPNLDERLFHRYETFDRIDCTETEIQPEPFASEENVPKSVSVGNIFTSRSSSVVGEDEHDSLVEIVQQDNELEESTNMKQNSCSQTADVSEESKPKKKRLYKKRLRKQIERQLCTICGKLYANLKHHLIQIHTDERKFPCDQCALAFKRKAILNEHVKRVHLKTPVKVCELCNRGFPQKSGYAAHMRSKHNVEEWFECKFCDLKFRHPGGLSYHINRKHNSASNCECPICGMIFEDKKGLRDHSRVHSTEKPFACKYCPKRFKGPTAHRSHELTHKGVVFSCTLCGKAYRYKTLLNIHLRKVHASGESGTKDTNDVVVE